MSWRGTVPSSLHFQVGSIFLLTNYEPNKPNFQPGVIPAALEDGPEALPEAPTCSGELKFFRVVDKSLAANLTLLGDTSYMANVDFVAHTLDILQLNTDDDNAPTSAVVAPLQNALLATWFQPLVLSHPGATEVKWLCKPGAHELLNTVRVWKYKPLQVYTFSAVEVFLVSVSFFSLHVRITLPRTAAEQKLLKNMLGYGAAGRDIDGCHCPDDEPGLQALLDKGHVRPMSEYNAPGWFTMTERFRSLIQAAFLAENPIPLSEYVRKNVSAAEMTTLELVSLLGSHGWTDETAARINSREPCSSGVARVWYRAPKAPISFLYLKTLATADGLIEHPVKLQQESIRHGQSKNYYKAVLAGCCNVLGGQPLAYYKQIMKKKGKEGARKQEQKRTSSLRGAGDEDIRRLGYTSICMGVYVSVFSSFMDVAVDS